MNFIKEELSVLDLYASVSDTKNFLYDKFCMYFNKEKNVVELFQNTSYCILLTRFEKDLSKLNKSFKIVGVSGQLNSLIKLTPKDSIIDINEIDIRFGKSKYELPKFDYDISTLNFLVDNVIDKPKDNFKLSDIDKFNDIKNFVGNEELDVFGLFDSYFVASNRTDFTGAIKTDNKFSDNAKFFPRILATISNYFSLKELDIHSFSDDNLNYTYVKINNTYVFFTEKDYILENIFKEEIKELYWHKTFVECDRLKFFEALQRICVVAQNNIFNRIFITIDNNFIKMESKDGSYAYEELECTDVSKELNNYTFIVSANNLRLMVSLLTGNIIKILCENNSDSVAITILDENENKFFIHNLYEDIDDKV
jgi:hypothetical protein